MTSTSGAPELDIADHPRALRALWRRAAFNVAVHNTDDHLKNHGVCWTKDGWQLSPAFDITPDPVAGATRTTQIDGENHPVREARALLGLALEFGIPAPEQRQILIEVLTSAGQWRSHAELIGISEGEINQVGRVLTESQQRLATALDH